MAVAAEKLGFDLARIAQCTQRMLSSLAQVVQLPAVLTRHRKIPPLILLTMMTMTFKYRALKIDISWLHAYDARKTTDYLPN
jgi:hypothetical protein